jgi:hypothetical protein
MRLAKIALASASIMFAFSSTAARAEYCQPGGSGCVLPLPGPAAAPGPMTSAPIAEPAAEVAEGGFDLLLPLLLGLAVIGIGAYFLLDDDGDSVSP